MSGLEVNKILASIILAVLIVTLIGHFGDLLINIDHHNDKETAYKIDVDEMPSKDSISVKKEEIIESLKEENKPAWWKTTYGIILISLVFFIILVLVLRYKILFDITKLFLIMV